MTTDRDLKRDIERELEWDPALDARRIGVAVVDGIATLTGEVMSYPEKWKAERATERIMGVKGIANDIEVRLAAVRTDADIIRAAVEALDADVDVPREITVRVDDGQLTLTGQVGWDYQRRAAARAVRGIVGVRGVTNLITLAPGVEPEDIKARIEETFTRAAVYDAGNVRIEVMGSEVALRGTVRSWVERNEAQKAAYAAPGVTAVHNYLVVRAD